ncbi:TetR/AcrR family transcriptional regulator [Paracoccus luteus]|uniref:TetR/AcrR family transcriptional regulator n=1 Tax=Paracoccus luteus TaxID=2508543 RepID=UPI00106F0E36|nr:TetR/AcrR family transcriptional regulator [Paracoccus luteus]
MTTTLPPAPRRAKERGSRELWLDAAYQALIESGVDSVRVLLLSDRLKLSRTSFYWFFETREELLEALLQRWERTNTHGLVSATESYAESPAEGVLNLLSCFIMGEQFDARFEFAVRSWALQSDDTMDRVRRADESRMAALRAMLTRFGYDEVDADVRARTIYLVQIGYISMQTRETVETRLSRVPTYVRIYTGTEPTPSEMARFAAPFGVARSGGPPMQIKSGAG